MRTFVNVCTKTPPTSWCCPMVSTMTSAIRSHAHTHSGKIFRDACRFDGDSLVVGMEPCCFSEASQLANLLIQEATVMSTPAGCSLPAVWQ
jgi:hypothetical protein